MTKPLRPPPDEGLKEPVRRFEDTLSVFTVIRDHFFPEGRVKR